MYLKSKSILLIICLIKYGFGFAQSESGVCIKFKNVCNLSTAFKSSNSIILERTEQISIFYEDSQDLVTLDKTKIQTPINVYPRGNYIILRHFLNFLDYDDYLFQKNDSILIEYKNKIPIISVFNRKTALHDFDSEGVYRKRFKFDEYSPISKYLRVLMVFGRKLFNDPKLMREQKKLNKQQIMERNDKGVLKLKKELYPDCQNYLIGYGKFLDSLKQQNLMSAPCYSFYKNKVERLMALLDIENNDFSPPQIQERIANRSHNADGYSDIYHHDVLAAVRDKYILPTSKKVEMDDGRNKDPRDVYMQIKNSELFSEKDKAYLMSREINRIAQSMPVEDLRAYFPRFQQDAKDSTLVSDTQKRWSLKLEDNDNELSQTTLWNTEKEKVTFQQLVSNNKENITYLDFWASWCGPCRAEMPASKKLSDEYTQKGIRFVYVSIDDDAVAWEKASKQMGLSDDKTYLLPNSKNSLIGKQFNISSIPRYILIGKDGKVINANAPRPSDPKIRQLFDELLKKK